MTIIPWKLIAKAFRWNARFDIIAGRPTLVVCHSRHASSFAGADAWKQAVLLSIRAPGTSLSQKRPPR